MSPVALITGASRGLGAGIASEFAELGYRLALCSRGKPALDSCHDVLTEQFDVRDDAALAGFAQRSIEYFGRIDVWINNAGWLEPVRPLREANLADWWALMEVNVRAVAHGSQLFARHVRTRSGGGVLFNISSGAAQHAYAGWTAYCASKAAVDLLSKALQLEERQAGLRVYSVAPGVIDTSMQESIRSADAADFPEVERFRAMKRENAYNTPIFVARSLHALAFESKPHEVVVHLPRETAD
jgi:NAD(P)-dependent dehydrogenase (short-subunit alcohol dehydrogenase family)